MSLTIGGITINNLSGPSSFGFIRPTEKFYNKLMIDSVPLQLLIGDTHGSLSNICTETTNSISVISNTWYNLIDSLGTKESPIDYYIETFYTPKDLNNSELKEYHTLSYNLQQKGYSKEEIREYNKSTAMFYIPNNYIYCFSKNVHEEHKIEKNPNICPTKNIRYHFVDTRVSNTSPSSELYYEMEIFNSLLKIVNDISLDEYLVSGSKYKSKEILLIAAEDIVKFAEIVYDTQNPHFISNSLIYKQTINFIKLRQKYSNPIKYDNIFRSIFIEYYKSLKFPNILRDVLEYPELIKQYDLSTIIDNTFDNSSNNIKTKFNTVLRNLKSFILVITAPFLDIYYLFRMLKPVENPSKLCVLHAGSYHINRIINFLFESNYYKIVDYVHWSKQTNEHNRCIQFNNIIDIDIFFPNQINLIRKRIEFFGIEIYIKLINSEKVSENEFKNKITDNIIKDLQLNFDN